MRRGLRIEPRAEPGRVYLVETAHLKLSKLLVHEIDPIKIP